jgi:hypothetical protein
VLYNSFKSLLQNKLKCRILPNLKNNFLKRLTKISFTKYPMKRNFLCRFTVDKQKNKRLSETSPPNFAARWQHVLGSQCFFQLLFDKKMKNAETQQIIQVFAIAKA